MAVNDFFVWGQGGSKKTPEQIAREREVADAILARAGDTSPVGHWTQGAARVVDALGGVVRQRRADAADAEIADVNKGLISSLLGGGTSAASSGAPIPMSSAGGEISATAPGTVGNVDPSIRSGIVETASALGIDPVDLATAISYETAGTFDPTKAGPTTQWGQHRGLIQFGEPQAKEYGVNWEDPIGSQLGENGAVANYLRATGVQPGMGLLDIYSAINAGGVGRYGASDANNGGAPGTVADKVNDQMAGHRAKALALLGTAPADATQAIEAVAPAAAAEVAATAPNAAVANSMPTQVAGGGDRYPIQTANTGINPAIIEALTNPQANEQTQRIASILLQQDQARQNAAMEAEMRNADPLRRLQIDEAQLKVDALRNPKPGYRTLSTEEKKALGLSPNGAFQIDGENKISQIGGGGVTINNEGTIPAGYQAIRDAEGRVTSIQPIPGSPAALEMEQALKTRETQGGRKETATDVITNAASEARKLIKSGTMTTGTIGRIASNLTESDAAELRRQVDVLKSNATIENLTAMRQASPTGGALGSVTEKEGAMLAAAAGAIDPNAGKNQVEKQLENYERTLLRVIHGPKVGDAIFEQTRQEKPISEMTDEELEALANGD